MDSSYNNFVREIGAAGQRLDLTPHLSYPVSPGGLFTITPRVGFRETIYDTRVVGTKEDHGFVVEDTVKELTVRSLFEAGVDLDARAQRVFDLDGAYGIQKLQHLIEPRVNYNFLDGDDSRDLPQYDGIDTISPGHTVTYSLTNRLKARAVGQDDQPGRVWEVIRFTLSQTYPIDPDATTTVARSRPDADHDHRRGPARRLAQETEPTPRPAGRPSGSRTSGRTSSSSRSGAFASAARRPSIRTRPASPRPPRTSPTRRRAGGPRSAPATGKTASSSFIQGAVEARIGSRWTVRFTSDYNIDTGTVIENRLEVDFREQCWGITAAFIDRVDEDEFRISINLLELGQYGFGRGFAGFQ